MKEIFLMCESKTHPVLLESAQNHRKVANTSVFIVYMYVNIEYFN